MTRTQRRRHLVIWIILTPTILGVVIAAITVRIESHAALARSPGPAVTGAHP